MLTALLIMRGKGLEPPLRLPPVHVTGPLIMEDPVAGTLNCPDRVRRPLSVNGSTLASKWPVMLMLTSPLSVAVPKTARLSMIESDAEESRLRLPHALGWPTV
jgi:hypothetical protein